MFRLGMRLQRSRVHIYFPQNETLGMFFAARYVKLDYAGFGARSVTEFAKDLFDAIGIFWSELVVDRLNQHVTCSVAERVAPALSPLQPPPAAR